MRCAIFGQTIPNNLTPNVQHLTDLIENPPHHTQRQHLLSKKFGLSNMSPTFDSKSVLKIRCIGVPRDSENRVDTNCRRFVTNLNILRYLKLYKFLNFIFHKIVFTDKSTKPTNLNTPYTGKSCTTVKQVILWFIMKIYFELWLILC